MPYQIITDQEKLLAFIDWLPDLEEQEKFYCCLFSRKKYAKTAIKASDKTQLKRFLATKDRLFEKIQQLEAPVGAYRLKEIAAPPESLALYINPNPRDLRKATYDGIMELTRMLRDGKPNLNPHAEIMSTIQRSGGKTAYLDFDIDIKPFDFSKLEGLINPDCLTVIETRGGYHLLVKVDAVEKQYKKSFFNKIKALGVDQTGDQLLPVPGCTQGGYTPHFIPL